MQNQKDQYDQIRRDAYLIGILYATIKSKELSNKPIDLSTIATVMQHHCSRSELEELFERVNEFSLLIGLIC